MGEGLGGYEKRMPKGLLTIQCVHWVKWHDIGKVLTRVKMITCVTCLIMSESTMSSKSFQVTRHQSVLWEMTLGHGFGSLPLMPLDKLGGVSIKQSTLKNFYLNKSNGASEIKF